MCSAYSEQGVESRERGAGSGIMPVSVQKSDMIGFCLNALLLPSPYPFNDKYLSVHDMVDSVS